MQEIQSAPADPANDTSLGMRQTLKVLDRKDWWHWWNAVLVIMLLMGAMVSMSLPNILKDVDLFSQLRLDLAVRGLLGLVLVFNVYMLYQQLLLRQVRTHLSEQIEQATAERVRAEAFYELAIQDPLTGLYNRRYCEEFLGKEIARAQRQGDPLIVLMLDLDNFKEINDQFGHFAGDTVLKEFARKLNKAIRGSDIAVRLGGDEFLVVLPDCAPENVQIVLSRMKDFEVELPSGKVLVCSSRGWAQYRLSDTIDELLGRADQALYTNKAARVEPVQV